MVMSPRDLNQSLLYRIATPRSARESTLLGSIPINFYNEVNQTNRELMTEKEHTILSPPYICHKCHKRHHTQGPDRMRTLNTEAVQYVRKKLDASISRQY